MTTPTDELREKIRLYVAGLAESGANFMKPEMVSDEVREDYVNSLVALVDGHIQSLKEQVYEVSRFEVIDHRDDSANPGRVLVVWEKENFKVEPSLQDDGRTLKIFLQDVTTSNKRERV